MSGQDRKPWSPAALVARVLDGTAATTAAGLDAAEGLARRTSDQVAPLAAFLAQPELLRWSRDLTSSSASVYDAALDAEYLRTRIGGGEHRLFDGGHDLLGSWEAARNALPNDSLAAELSGWLLALWRDGTTPAGLPLVSISKDQFDAWARWVQDAAPFIDRAWLYDLLSVDVFELLSCGLGLGAALFCLSRAEQERVAEALGSLGVVALLTANPLLGLGVVLSACWSFRSRKPLDTARLARGGTTAAISVAVFSVLGLPVLVELAIVLAAHRLLRRAWDKPSDVLELLNTALTHAGAWTDTTARRLRHELRRTPTAKGSP